MAGRKSEVKMTSGNISSLLMIPYYVFVGFGKNAAAIDEKAKK